MAWSRKQSRIDSTICRISQIVIEIAQSKKQGVFQGRLRNVQLKWCQITKREFCCRRESIPDIIFILWHIRTTLNQSGKFNYQLDCRKKKAYVQKYQDIRLAYINVIK